MNPRADLPAADAAGAFPRRRFSVNINRRGLLPALWSMVKGAHCEARGTPVCEIADLGAWPDERLAGVIPHFVPGSQVDVRDDIIWGWAQAGDKPKRITLATPEQLSALRRFHGDMTLADIASIIADENGLAVDRGFALVRDLFLMLAAARLCVPANMA